MELVLLDVAALPEQEVEDPLMFIDWPLMKQWEQEIAEGRLPE